jgi:hypothetical protein
MAKMLTGSPIIFTIQAAHVNTQPASALLAAKALPGQVIL